MSVARDGDTGLPSGLEQSGQGHFLEFLYRPFSGKLSYGRTRRVLSRGQEPRVLRSRRYSISL